MSGAKANRTYIASVKETEWGTTPQTPAMQKINFTGESLNFEISSETPNTIRDDRMVSDVILTGAGNTGGYEFEMQFNGSGPGDEHLLAALWAEKWIGVDGDNAELTVTGATLSQSQSRLDMSGVAGSKGSMIVGQFFALNGTANDGANDNIYQVTEVVDANNGIYAIYPAPAADETLDANAKATGQMAKNGVTRHSFTLERGHGDVNQYFQFKGMVVNEWTLNVEAEAVMTGGFTFIGKEVETAQAPVGQSYANAASTQIMSASFNVGLVELNGMPVSSCLIQQIELNVNNNVEGKTAVGEFGFCDTSEGEFESGGALNMYFTNMEMFDRFRMNTPFSVSIFVLDRDGNVYVFTLPRVKLSADTINATAKNTDVMDAAAYQAIVDPTTNCMIQISKMSGTSGSTLKNRLMLPYEDDEADA